MSSLSFVSLFSRSTRSIIRNCNTSIRSSDRTSTQNCITSSNSKSSIPRSVRSSISSNNSINSSISIGICSGIAIRNSSNFSIKSIEIAILKRNRISSRSIRSNISSSDRINKTVLAIVVVARKTTGPITRAMAEALGEEVSGAVSELLAVAVVVVRQSVAQKCE